MSLLPSTFFFFFLEKPQKRTFIKADIKSSNISTYNFGGGF